MPCPSKLPPPPSRVGGARDYSAGLWHSGPETLTPGQSLILSEALDQQLLRYTNDWVLKKNKRSGQAQGRGARCYLENWAPKRRAGKLLALSLSASEKDSQAVAYCEENSLSLLEPSPVLLCPFCGDESLIRFREFGIGMHTLDDSNCLITDAYRVSITRV
ncbi:hypothetical protein HGM15179_020662 [Zosterops borbonicus]|uniref:Uncharacterized protein n=1 Tax=Zosterops borbonicus TaxID=364589 RepID=A0A8K1FXI1_9PASS|nr:hypothetical protein HGM15179_020662 [Zosterops borbonicus]